MQPHPFYPFSQEDRQIKQAKKSGLVTHEARVTQELRDRCCQYPFKLDSECRMAILSILTEESDVKCRFPLHIKNSMQEICLEVRKVANEKIKILFVAGGLVKALKPLFIDFFDHCGLNDMITTLFKDKLNTKPNDYDFQFLSSADAKEIVDVGVVSLLASKINWELINPSQLMDELKRFKKHSERIPYLKQVFAEHPKYKDLAKLAVKVFAFVKANDSAGHYYFRNIASSENSYDCFIPVGDPPKINSFCIDISQIDKEDTELYLESLLGKEMLLQAIIDANFAILYSDPNHPANELDFARTICHLSKRGRLSGNGWLAKAYAAFNQEREKREWTLSTMLLTQLVSRADSHHRSPQALIVLAFNASAILINMDPTLEAEIQKLWEEIGNHIIKAGKGGLNDPLIKQIKILMCDSGCSFRVLLSQIQVSAMLSQHEGKGSYRCLPTQSEEMLYTQVVIHFSEKENVDIGTLVFPFALSESIAFMEEHSLKSIHDLLTEGSTVAVGINKSVLRKDKYRLDTRRKFSESTQGALNLLKIKGEEPWRMGFLLTLSHLAMSDDEMLLKDLLEKLISMLLNQWASDGFKAEMAFLMHSMLINSGISVRDAFFQAPMPNSIIGDLLSSDNKCLKDLGWRYFKKVENKPHAVLEKLYLDLVNSSSEVSLLKDLLKYMANSNQLSIESALKVYSILFSKSDLQDLEEDLLEAVLGSIQKIKTGKEGLPALLQLVLESKACERFPHLGLCIAWEAHRLKIFSDTVTTLHNLTISAKEINSIYFTEKFDVRSDFMRHYSLQSVPALKASVLRCIKPEDRIYLLQLLATSWDERVFIMSFPADEKVMEIFIKTASNRKEEEQVQFYIEQTIEGLLHPLLILMGDERTDEEFVLCTEKILLEKKLTISHREEISERFVKQLYDRMLWQELKSLYFADPQILLEWTPLLLSIFIRTYHHLGKPEFLLSKIPLDLELPDEDKETLRSLLRESQDKALEQERFIEALSFVKKLKTIEDPEIFVKQSQALIPALLQYKEEKPGLYELLHQVFCWTNPDPILLSKYIQLALTNAPVDILEKILDLLPDNGLIDPVLKKLEDLDSKKFLHPMTWWPAIWEKIKNEPEDLKRRLVYRLIFGASNAYTGDRNLASGINEVLKILESDEIASFISPQEKMFTCPLRVEFARLCWFSEVAEQRSKALSILYKALLLVGDDPLVEKNAIYLLNAILQTTPHFKSTKDIHSTLLLIQRVHESGSVEFADHVAILRFLMSVSIESDAKNKNQEDEEFFKRAAPCILYYINENIKAVLSRSLSDSEIKSHEKNLVKWGVNKLQDSELLWGYDLAGWCLENPYISVYLGDEEIKKLKAHKDSLRGGCKVIIKVLHAWDEVKRCKDVVTSPIKRCIYLSGEGLKDQFQIQSGERKALEKTLSKTVKLITQVTHVIIIITAVANSILIAYNRSH